MSGAVIFELPSAWLFGLPLALLLGWAAWRQRRRGLAFERVAVLLGLRALPVLLLLFLAARPVRVATEPAAGARRPVVILVDKSESMSVREADTTRYERGLDFLSHRLVPALESAKLPVQEMVFDASAEPVSATQIRSIKPAGKRTNLAGAIAQALGSAQTPLAVIALTDGIANEVADNARAMNALLDCRIPFIGVGFGSDQGAQTLSLRQVEAPAAVAPRATFSLSAQIEVLNADEAEPFDLILFRDGQMAQKKSLTMRKGSRSWVENFQLSESAQGVHNYRVQLLPPSAPNLKCPSTQASTEVRVSDESELRVLYIQGALTWDYKFIALALRNDPSLKLTGLTRTSKESEFRQNVETAGELLNGFPTTLEELAPFRVVVLGDLRPEDLSLAQQELLARFCGELGGGVLMVGGPATFNSSWQSSKLEKLLPVVFSATPAGTDLDHEFRVELADDALAHPLFDLARNGSARAAWKALPPFTRYGRVDSAKLGAQVWMVHPNDTGPAGRRILMASQRYGAGLSTVVCLQNFWRWRLAKDCDPEQFDRFWRQMFRWLGDAGRQRVSIDLAEQDLRSQADVRVLLERQADPQISFETNHQFLVEVRDCQDNLLRQESVELDPDQQVDFRFQPAKPGSYTLKVLDANKALAGSRSVEIRDTSIELEQTARDMETLRQWASLSDGLAFKVEECPKTADLVAQIRSKVEQVRRGPPTRQVIGLNGWSLGLLLGCLSAEWLLRKRWTLI